MNYSEEINVYKICFYVPEEYVEQVKNALFDAGAGRIGDYSHCAWQTKGFGQFMPLQGNNAFIGSTNRLETVAEYKVELICGKADIHAAISALKRSHPYETPAYQVIRCEDF